MPVTRDDVKRLADLARLDLTDEECASLEKDLDAILGYVDRLQEIDVTHVEPHAMPARESGWRKDDAFTIDDVTRELILANFPERQNDCLRVPPVFEKPKGSKTL